MKTKKTLTYISLFSCAGIGCYGFKQAGFECIASNEIIEKRLQIQRYNNKCLREEGYIQGDITLEDTKNKIFSEIDWWKANKGIDGVDILIATPPCQGMSIFNHKKNDDDIHRNSLVVESIEMVCKIKPKIFLFENVPAFMTTICCLKNGERLPIKHAIRKYLLPDYLYYYDTINFKNYGSNSSRTRTLVIGVRRDLAKNISPVELFPSYQKERTLREVIGHLPHLKEMSEIDPSDIYHSFRPYPIYMREWIEDIGEGESAFDNVDERKRPYKFDKNGNRVANVNKTGDKYTRQEWNKVAPSVHTRNDQLASQKTIHPDDDRVLSVRELMLIMSIPYTFRWSDKSINELNNLALDEKRRYLKSEESNIRQCIGEAVPTAVFYNIAILVANALQTERLTDNEIIRLIEHEQLNNSEKLIEFMKQNYGKRGRRLDIATLSRLAELANSQRSENAAYYTEKETLTEIFQHLPLIEQDTIRVLEPSVGAGNFIPFIIKKYSYAQRLYIDVIDIDKSAIKVFRELKKYTKIPENVRISVHKADFLLYKTSQRYDLVVGNPPFINFSEKSGLNEYRKKYGDDKAKNSAAFFLYKSIQISNHIAFVLPKNFLCNSDYDNCRTNISKLKITSIIDFGHRGFAGVRIETILLSFNTQKRGGKVDIVSIMRHEEKQQMQRYITDPHLPTWVLYRNEFFDRILYQKQFGVFDVFRDRQITKTATTNGNNIWVVKAKNITRDGLSLIHIPSYDTYIAKSELDTLHVASYLERTDVFLVPNMTYYPRMMRKPAGIVTNGSVAIFIPKKEIVVDELDMEYIASKEYEDFYKIARNFANRSLNIDRNTVFYFCINKK